MNNEELQRLVLEKLGGIEGRLGGMEGRLGSLEEGQNEMKKDINEIKLEQRFMWEDIKKIDNRLERQEIKLRKVAP